MDPGGASIHRINKLSTLKPSLVRSLPTIHSSHESLKEIHLFDAIIKIFGKAYHALQSLRKNSLDK